MEEFLLEGETSLRAYQSMVKFGNASLLNNLGQSFADLAGDLLLRRSGKRMECICKKERQHLEQICRW